MGDLVTSTEHRHMSIRALALFAQRTRQVFAHPTDGVVESLAAGRLIARAERVEINQAASCPVCPRAPPALDSEGAAA